MATKHKHQWKVESLLDGTQVRITCECGTEIWVCPYVAGNPTLRAKVLSYLKSKKAQEGVK